MRIAFRTDASAQIGSGHAMRCLTLADALKKRGAQTVFVSRILPPALKQQIGNHGHELLLLEERHAIAGSGDLAHSGWLGVPQEIDAADTRRALGERGLDWIIVDHYALDRRWESALRPATARMMAIDDLADRAHDCDLLLDQNFRASHEGRYDGLVPQHCVLKLGPAFALLQEDYARLRAQVRPRERLRRLLIYFGGGDTGPLTGMALEAALQLGDRDLTIDIVGPSDPVERERLGRLAAGNPAITLHDTLPSLAPMMAQADLAIGGSGATNWERLCLGLPAVVVTLAVNQVAIARDLHESGLVVLAGSVDEIVPESISDSIRRIIANLHACSIQCMNVCDGSGVARMIDALDDFGLNPIDER
jgi:UDP-2,4-diacetamido-2,4,6-trideoxy-beta-L-altropyranose hydrolase